MAFAALMMNEKSGSREVHEAHGHYQDMKRGHRTNTKIVIISVEELCTSATCSVRQLEDDFLSQHDASPCLCA